MKHFTRQNMPGYTDEEIANLNAEFDIKLGDFLDNMDDATTAAEFETWLRAFDAEVRARRPRR